jgi:hypothetical protein
MLRKLSPVNRMQNKIIHKIGNKSFENAENFKCWGMTLENRKHKHEEIKSRINFGHCRKQHNVEFHDLYI